jgi:hypothetical protein
VSRAQWSDFDELYLNHPSVGAFLHQFHMVDASSLAWILRNHLKTGVSDGREQELRDGADFLLGYYAMLEIASLIGYVEEPLPAAVAAEALAILSDPAMTDYYSIFYPVELPKLFRQRLEGTWRQRVEPKAELSLVFWRFQGFVSRNRENQALLTLMRFLDGFISKDEKGNVISIESIAETFGNPEQVLMIFLRERNQMTVADQVVDGIREFFEFAKEFDALLSKATDSYLRAELWLYYNYYFQGPLSEALYKHLSLAAQHIREVNAKSQDVESLRSREAFDQYWQAIERLRSGIYGRAILG